MARAVAEQDIAVLRAGSAGAGAGDPHVRHDLGGDEFQSYRAASEGGVASAGDVGGVCVVEASELFRVFLVGVGESDHDGECGLFRGVWGCAVEVL